MLASPKSMAHDRARNAFRHLAFPRQRAPTVPKRMHGVTSVRDAHVLPQKQACIVLEPVCSSPPLHWNFGKEPGFAAVLDRSIFRQIDDPQTGRVDWYVTYARTIFQRSIQIMDANNRRGVKGSDVIASELANFAAPHSMIREQANYPPEVNPLIIQLLKDSVHLLRGEALPPASQFAACFACLHILGGIEGKGLH